MKNTHPARLYSLIEVALAAVCAFLPLAGPQVAALLAVAAVATGEQVRRKA